MLESLVASILNRVLGSYVENFDPRYLNIGLLSGDVKLGNLRLKRGALDQLRLPVDVVEGHIGSLVLQIPYSNLKSKPVKVVLEDVFLLAAPDLGGGSNAGEERRAQQAKRDKLELWELGAERAAAASTIPKESDVDSQNFTTSLVTKIIDNLQVTIKNIHIRYEDDAVALGATLAELSAVSTNEEWEPAFIADGGAVTHKLATLDSFAVYVDSAPEPKFGAEDQAALLQAFRDAIGDSIGANDVLRPINGQGFVTLNKRPELPSTPKVRAELKFEELAVAIDRQRYVDLIKLADKLQTYSRTRAKRSQLRPKKSPKEEPLAWFRYAGESVLQEVREHNKRWQWPVQQKRIADMQRYIALYRTKATLTAADRREFDALEVNYSYDDLVLWRSTAKRLMLVDPKAPGPQKQTWGQWLWGSAPADGKGGDGEADDGLTPEQREELLAVLDIPDHPVEDTDSQVLMEVEFSLQSTGIRLTHKDEPLASLSLAGVHARFAKRPDNFMLSTSVAEFNILDLEGKSAFREIVRQIGAAEGDSPFFWFQFEHHPLDRAVDSVLVLKSRSVAIVHNARFLEGLVAFFAPPPDQAETVDAILNAANKTVEELREQTRIGLEYALENHKTLYLVVDVQAPVIIVPLDPTTENSPATVLDVGSLGIKSDLAPPDVLEQVKERQTQRYTSEDWSRLESLMYDRFTISLHDTQVLLGNSMVTLREALGKSSSPFHFLDKATLNFLLEVSIVPQTRTLPRSRLTFTMPDVRAALSDVQYKLFMATLDAAVPRFDGSAEPSSLPSEKAHHHKKESHSSENSKNRDRAEGKDDASKDCNDQQSADNEMVLDKDKDKKKDKEIAPDLVVVVQLGEVHLTLMTGWDARPLVELSLHKQELRYWTTPHGMALDISILNLLVQDYGSHGGDASLRKMVESAKSSERLFEVKLRSEPGNLQTVDMKLAEMKFVLDPITFLAIYDFVMSTFASPGDINTSTATSSLASTTQSSLKIEDNQTDYATEASVAVVHRDVSITLQGIKAELAEGSEVLATLQLASARMTVMLHDALKFKSILGPVSLVDTLGTSILSIDGGGDLADFRYETQADITQPSLVYFRSEPPKVVLVEEPLARLASYATHFAAMKSVYDQARMLAYGQALQLEPSAFLLDVVVSAPIVKYISGADDWLEAHLGELFVQNHFVGEKNELKAGIRGVHVIASVENKKESIVGNTDLIVELTASADSSDQPAAIVRSKLSPIRMSLSEHHYRMVMQLVATTQRITQSTGGPGEAEIGDLRRRLASEKQLAQQQESFWNSVYLQPKLESKRDQLDFVFNAPQISAELRYGDAPLTDFRMEDAQLSTFVDAAGVAEAHLHIRSFVLEDTRTNRDNKFPQIVPPAAHDGYQLMARLVVRPGEPPEINVSVDSPQVIVALDYLTALQAYAEHGVISSDKEIDHDSNSDAESYEEDSHSRAEASGATQSLTSKSAYSSDSESGDEPPMLPQRPSNCSDTQLVATNAAAPKLPTVSFSAVDLYLTVLADASNPQTEAVVFKIEEFVVNLGETSRVDIHKVGMFLTQMHASKEQRLRIIDDFSITGNAHIGVGSQRSTEGRLSIEPLVIRFSLREMLLIASILQRASALASPGPSTKHLPPTGSSAAGSDTQKQSLTVPEVISELVTVEFEGMRLVVIDPIHQLPMSDFVVKPFALTAKQWSLSLNVDAVADMHANVYSFAKSAWEPLVDSLELGLAVRGTSDVEIFSNSVADVEVTPETLALIDDVRQYFATESEPSRTCEDEGSPYRIVNDTGVSVKLWGAEGTSGSKAGRTLEPGETANWSFFDWRALREDLSATTQRVALGMLIEGFKPLEDVPVNAVGEHLYNLSTVSGAATAADAVNDDTKAMSKLVVEIKIKKHLKYIMLRSTAVVGNETLEDLELLLSQAQFRDVAGTRDDILLRVPSGESRALPLSHVDSRIRVRRTQQGFTGNWSENSIYWQDLRDEALVRCGSDWYLRVLAETSDAPLARRYPYLRLNLTPPFVLANNLTVPLEMRVYSKDSRRDITLNLEAGAHAPLHGVNTQQLLLLSVKATGYEHSESAVMSTGRHPQFQLEDALVAYSTRTDPRQKLTLRVQYVDQSRAKGRVVVVYAPYMVLNHSGRELELSTRVNRALLPPEQATMWSFESRDTGQKAGVRAQRSHWSSPIAFDAVGSVVEATVTSQDNQSDLHLGVQVLQGSGRYAMTKVVAIAPRFVLLNALGRDLEVREPGGNRVIPVSPVDSANLSAAMGTPLGFLSNMSNNGLCLRWPDGKWSAAVALVNVGSTWVRVNDNGKPTTLVEVEISLQNATLYIKLGVAKNWPYSVRNFTDHDFHFWQSNPFLDVDGDAATANASQFVPIKYHLPARSAMPYSWDFPAAQVKELVVEGHDRRRKVQMAELGELPPARLGEGGEQVALSVVADGPLQALVITDHAEEDVVSERSARTAGVTPPPQAGPSSSSTLSLTRTTTTPQTQLQSRSRPSIAVAPEPALSNTAVYRLNLNGIGISYVSNVQEILYATLRNISLEYSASSDGDMFSWQVQWIQVDNALANGSTDFPVLVYPSVVPKQAEEIKRHPTLSGSIARVFDESYSAGLMYIKHATLLIQELTFETDEDFLVQAMNAFLPTKTDGWRFDDDETTSLLLAPTRPPNFDRGVLSDIYFEQLHLQPIQLNLSFLRTGALTDSGIFAQFSGNMLSFVVDALTMAIGNINDAPVRFNALLIDNVRTQPELLLSTIQTHYAQEFLYQLHKIIGSADVFGNPVGLFNNISSGVMDLFYEPYMGYTLSDRPQELGVGLARGGLSFMKKSVFGVSDSVAKVTGSLSKGLAAITMDPNFQKSQRSRHTRNHPRHAVSGLQQGAESLYGSFASGVAGLASAPIQGAATGGTSGFLRGLGRGLIGLPTKTAIGVLDFASSLSEGVRNTATVFDGDATAIARVRLPRFVAADGVVRPYNRREAVGQMILHSVGEGQFSGDHYVAHSNLTKDKVVLISMEGILVASMEGFHLEWAVSYDQLSSLVMEPAGIALELRGGTRGPFIPVPDNDTRHYLYRNAGTAVAEFNRIHTTLY